MGRLLTLLRRKGGFSPLDLPGLALWLDASDESTITHDTGAVSQWDDKSGNARHVVQATAANQPTTGTRTVNGKNAIEFASGDFLRKTTAANLAQPNTAIVAVVHDSATDWFLLDSTGSINRHFVYSRLSANQLQFGADTARAGAGLTAGVASIVTAVFDGASSVMRENGAVIVSADVGSESFDLVTVGASNSDFAEGDGVILEVLVCNSSLSTTDREAAEEYLAAKWGVTLA